MFNITLFYFFFVWPSAVVKLTYILPNKTSPLDLMPTNVLKLCAGILSSIIVRMANLSFQTEVFPTSFRIAQVTPILKKQGLSADDPANVRPISNSLTVSKILERLFLRRLNPHLAATGSMDPYQSAYCSCRSTETAMLRVSSDLCGEMDNGQVSMLITLDISAAFDTIDVSILLDRLCCYFGVTGMPLKWIGSYLEHRKQYVIVKLNGVESAIVLLQARVPHGSVLGPVLFSAFLAPLANVIDLFGISHHQYADDTSLYYSFSPAEQIGSVELISKCLSAVNSWFLTNGLLVNPGKSDSIYIGTSVQTRKISGAGAVMSETSIPLSGTVRSLGVLLDQRLSLEDHVKNVCRVCNYHIKGLRSLRGSTAETIGRSIVMSRLDYCNSLLIGTLQAEHSSSTDGSEQFGTRCEW